MKPALLTAIRNARRAKRPVVLATRVAPAADAGAEYLLPDNSAPLGLQTAGEAALADDASRTVTLGTAEWFLHTYNPAPRLILIGAVHIAQSLVPMAIGVGFEVILVDPRRAFATADRFPGVTLELAWPDEALDRLRPDRRTAVITLSHDPKFDDPALDRALSSPAFYIGALGSRRVHAARLERLSALGHTPAELARIHGGPIGLSIGASTTPEIALSILADLVRARRGKGAEGQKKAAA